MKLTTKSRQVLSDIPSASGIEIVGNKFYIVGDDSPWVFKLNDRFEIEKKIQIADIPTSGNKIPKIFKLDMEAMASLGKGENTELLLFGSGSKSPERDVLLRIKTASPYTVKKYSIVQLYENLCMCSGLIREELNLEAAAVIENTLFLFNRGKNIVFKLNALDFLSYLENNGIAPIVEVLRITLPSLNGREIGFSGASSVPDLQEIVFTASAENTTNWIDDGEILGSFVGILSLDELQDGFCPACIAVKDLSNNILKIKIESVAVYRIISPKKLHLLLVTDDDGTTSELIEAELEY